MVNCAILQVLKLHLLTPIYIFTVEEARIRNAGGYVESGRANGSVYSYSFILAIRL